MLFNSYEFIFVFLPVTWGVFMLLARRAPPRACYWWLTLASIVFYAWMDYTLLGLLFFSLAFNFSLARFNTTAFSPRLRKWLLAAGILVNVGLIAYYKYSSLVVDVLDQFLPARIDWTDPILPLAISFYTFEQIAFLVSCYRDNGRTPRFDDYVFFIIFFPQLIAGPILHYTEIVPQIKRPYIRVSRTQLAMGVSLVAIGLAKKVILADQLNVWFHRGHSVITGGYVPSLLDAWLTMISGSVSIYFDFSGYSDIAIGLALLFGLKLPMNFDSPHKATTLAEFWRRWNMTLMRFLRLHVYIPLGGSRHGRLRQVVAIFVTFTLCGLWHGAGWNWALWGLTTGFFLTAELLVRGPAPQGQAAVVGVLGRVRARVIVFFCFIFSTALLLFPDIPIGVSVMKSLVGLNGVALPASFADKLLAIGIDLRGLGLPVAAMHAYFGREPLLLVITSLVVIYLLPNGYDLFRRFKPIVESPGLQRAGTEPWVLFRWHPTSIWILITVGLMVVSIIMMRTVKEFFYFQF